MGRIAGVSAEETRERLRDAAARVFAEQGYEGARVSVIAREAGLTTGAIYAHYRSKAELLADALRARGPDEVNQLLSGTSTASVADLLHRIGTQMVERRRPAGSPSLLVEAVLASRRDPEVMRLLTEGVDTREAVLAELIKSAQAVDSLDPTLPPAALARLCLTLMMGALVVDALDLAPPATDEWSAVIGRLIDAVQPLGDSKR